MLLRPLVVVRNREGTDVTSDVTYALIEHYESKYKNSNKYFTS